MRKISSFFTDKVNIPLYHYTSIKSLLGMADKGKLWASSISYLNDSQEMVYAFNFLVKKSGEFDVRSEEEEEFLRQLRDYISNCKNTAHTLFVFSLSEEQSLLSQWRSYTPHGKGVSLEFSPEKINSIVSTCDLKVAKCLYTQDDHSELVQALLNTLMEHFRDKIPEIDTSKWHKSQCYYGFFNDYSSDIFRILSIIKHGAFREEREWRLISPHFVKVTDPKIKFREGASMLVPYIELDLMGKPYFTKITLGPSQHQDLSMSGLSMFASNMKVCNQVENCVIPYREW